MPKICARYIHHMPKICSRYISDMSQIYSRYVQNMFQICPRYVPEMSKMCPNISKICPRYVLGMSQICHRSVSNMNQIFPLYVHPKRKRGHPPRWQTTNQPTTWKRAYEALQDNYCATLFTCWTPTLRLKMSATDSAFWWCRSLVPCFCFSAIKCVVFPKTRRGRPRL